MPLLSSESCLFPTNGTSNESINIPCVESMDGYRFAGRMGEGTFSEVLKCQSLVDGKLYACKKMKQKYDSVEQVNNLREIQALRRLNPHPNVIELKEVIFDRHTGTLALICELMDMNIYELIKDRKSYLPEQKVKLYMYQLCKSIYHMHRNGIFHRDVKPENILIKDTVLKLADFGSCKSVYSKQPYTEYISTRWYRAPECLLTDGYYDHKMDMWSVGCVIFEVMSLRPLFPGSNELDQIARIHGVVGTPTPPVLQKFKKHQSRHVDFNFPYRGASGISPLMKHASRGCIDLVTQLCAYDPDERLTAKQALRHPYFKDLREAERRAKQIVRSPSISGEVTATKILSGFTTSNNSRRSRQHRGQEHGKTHLRNQRINQLPSVPEYYKSGHHHHHPKKHHEPAAHGDRGFALPQIESRAYTHLQSGVPSGYTSMPFSNKSTSHGSFLPTIYPEKTAVKHTLYPQAGAKHHHHIHKQQHHGVPQHLPAITSTKHTHHARTGAG